MLGGAGSMRRILSLPGGAVLEDGLVATVAVLMVTRLASRGGALS